MPRVLPADAKAWFDAGEIPELTPARGLTYVDIDSGHWPMFTQPAELARILAGVAGVAGIAGGRDDD